MKLVRALDELPVNLKGSVIAIGNFDGVHKGHQAVINVAKALARDADAPCGVMTFEPHPREFFSPEKPVFRLTGEAQKIAVFDALSIDLTVVLAFDEALSSLSAEEFVITILVDGLGVSQVVTGFDFFFGRGREGTPDVMRAFGEKFGFGVTIVEAQSDEADVYSSSRIRDALRRGAVEEAAQMLGYWWRVSGRVEPGAGRGHGLGFPTLNLSLDQGQELKQGTYAVRVSVSGKKFGGAAYFGTRPTFDDGPDPAIVLEVFLFDFHGDLYGQEVTVEFIRHLRGDERFEGAEALAGQMALDCDEAQRVINALEERDPHISLKIGD